METRRTTLRLRPYAVVVLGEHPGIPASHINISGFCAYLRVLDVSLAYILTSHKPFRHDSNTKHVWNAFS